jgi:tRNA threonylcarbamoyladenosine biosynthesis protein TsaB
MKILAIETTDRAGSVALLDGPRLLNEVRLSAQQRSAQSLAPAIRDLLETADWAPSAVRLVAVAIGPGSFTGLRVGLTTAKTFAYAVECDLVAVPTLEVVAAQIADDDIAPNDGIRTMRLLAVLDAGRQQVFAARFARTGDGRLECLEPTALVDDAAWLGGVRPGDLVSGPGLRKFAGHLPDGAIIAPAELWAPRAATVGGLAFARHASGQRDDPCRLVPQYHRASAAEEKLDEKPRRH